MPRLGSREQRAACYLFNESENILDRMNKSSMEDIRMNINLYKGYILKLKYMLKNCKPWMNEEEHAKQLLHEPDYENMWYDICEYTYENTDFLTGRDFIYESEIKDMLAIISVKMEECVKYITELNVNAGVALSLIYRNYTAS